MLLFLDIYHGIVVEILRRGEIAQDVNAVGDELLGVIIVGQVDVFTVVFYVFKQVVIVESRVVGAVKILLGNIKSGSS